ncbi:MAG: excisionase family DNA-binding protein [Deltaproteobacteria bacterium]|nr:excisionase family DNA-binding protein [Deltaproteobacteria bacterium]
MATPASKRHPDPDPQTQLGLSTRECASRVGVHDFTIRRAIWDGQLAHFRVGRAVRIRPADLAAWVDGLVRGGAR